MSNDAARTDASAKMQDDDEPDDWDKRIFSTGCADENMKLTDCYYEKKDWRLCKKETSDPSTGILARSSLNTED
ncbi:hypothetical protein P171DRAFT_520925 [Karstenula rhodostoma CBS 690.94]|uniref:CHCH domain-containing protein n=1 Tax=Karstenula rhodostoma CBS 690.94 TaxID=1392251 RepID=A0A9P4PKZ0_9PLEO|nr:hypothetical protein P171DRAFT_520925 [Karstenula rhodostoma CBS 690.94]